MTNFHQFCILFWILGFIHEPYISRDDLYKFQLAANFMEVLVFNNWATKQKSNCNCTLIIKKLSPVCLELFEIWAWTVGIEEKLEER